MNNIINNLKAKNIDVQYTEQPFAELSDFEKKFKPNVPDGTAVIDQVGIDVFTNRYAGRVILAGKILKGNAGAEFKLICYACDFTHVVKCLTDECRIYDDAALEISEDNNKVSYPPSIFIQDGIDNIEKYAIIHPKLGGILDIMPWRKYRIENKAFY